ncbi:acyltransferase family protein [Polaromonas sp. DSR2-3-2]|uniref:acyltransferase family protein n=1 Tax=unclassified Polaromonas TaxID=2638319 RepID=UPI003CFA6E71
MQPLHQPLLSHPKYRADIDGLRALAVLSVVIFHAFPTRLVGGFIGVDIFFVISGFLISTIIFSNLRSDSFSYLEFYRRRIRRIFPALVVVLLACLGLGWFGLLAGEYQQVGRHTLGGIGFISNLMLWSEAGYDYFNTASESKPLLHLWSLAIEEQFYIIWPLLLVLLWKRRGNFVGVACSIALVSFAFNVLSFPEHAQAAFYSPLSRFWELIIGGLLAYALMHKAGSMARYANAQSTLGMALIVAGLVFVNSERAFPGWWALLPTLGAALLISAGPLAWFNKTVLSNPVAVWFGKISYPLYLWHWPLLSLAMLWNNEETPAGPVRLGLVLLAIALAWLTYKFIELPIRVGNTGSTPQLVGAFCLVGLLAMPIVLLNGFPGRYINKDETRVFLDQYKKLTRLGLSDYYQEQCDFSEWTTGKNKGSIDAACTATSGDRPVYLLWGDSHGQALSFGIRKNISPLVQLAQVVTSGCKPKLHPDPKNGTDKSACQASNEFAIEFIKKHKPARVFIVQSQDHQLTDWKEMARLVEANHGELVLVGPVPQWRPSLPVIVARDLKAKHDYVAEGLDPKVLDTDGKLHAIYATSNVRFVSIIDRLCRLNECRAKVPSYDGFDLIALDYGHLTPAGSDFVAKQVLQDFLSPPDLQQMVSAR